MKSFQEGQFREGEEAPATPAADLSAGRPADLPEAATSPGLRVGAGPGRAYELKFELSLEDIVRMKAWAGRHLQPDPHAGADGSYRVTSVYCDTSEFDVFHRSPGYRRSKLRMRRYGEAPFVFLERKIRRGDEVRKRRVEVSPGDLFRLSDNLVGTTPQVGWDAAWFLDYATKKGVAPACRVGYGRTAFFGMSDGQAVRVTIDENLVGVPAKGWEAQPLEKGVELLPGRGLLELKFHDTMPDLFRRLLPDLPLQAARVSKYRRCVRLCGLAQDRIPSTGPTP